MWSRSAPKAAASVPYATQPTSASASSAAAAAGGHEAHQLKVANCPNNTLALTNFAFLSAVDLEFFAEYKGGKLGFVEIAGNVLTVSAESSVEVGSIALNGAQRRNARVSTGDFVAVSKFTPPSADFELAAASLEIDFHAKGRGKPEQLDGAKLGAAVVTRFSGQVLSVGQKVSFEHQGTNYLLSVLLLDLASGGTNRGLLTKNSAIVFEAAASSGIKVANQKVGKAAAMFKQKEFNFEKLGIGGLDAQFADIFRRAFASRVFPPHIISKLGISHVKGMLLFGPPGTGKTLIARQIGKMLNGKEPKVVNGPEILDKFVGASEQNIRNLFADAEKDQKEHGDESDLHIIIFDEIDAICKSRGSTRDGTGVHDSIVNQLLTKIDGVDALNNILLIGMTNRRDMLDEALLRPGRLEVQIEIGLPDEAGRVKILQIHSNRMKENSFLANDVDLHDLAARTKNFSGAELEGLVKSAVSFALSRQTDPSDLSKPIDEESIQVAMADFEAALGEVRPAFGANVKQLAMYRLNGLLSCLSAHHHILDTAKRQVAQVKGSERSPLLTCLLEGDSGSGKTALAASIAMDSDVPYIKLVSADTMVGMSEVSKCAALSKVFDDAYKSVMSIIILDDIERLLEYVSIGPRFSNLMLQTILVLIKKLPPEGHKLFVIGTTSLPPTLQRDLHLTSSFNTVLNVPTLTHKDMVNVLTELNAFSEEDVEIAVEALQSTVASLNEEMTIKKLLMLVEMASQTKDEDGALESLYKCLKDFSQSRAY